MRTACLGLALAAGGCAGMGEDKSYQPSIDPSNFGGPIDNPYYPLIPGTIWRYKSDGDEGPQENLITVTSDTRVIMGVACVVVHDVVSVGGKLKEDTYDWYAQDREGNVWYFGEDTSILDANGKVVDTKGTWTAGVDGALPGIFMPAQPAIGYTGEQEVYVGNAEDRYAVLLTNASVKVKYGSFTNALVTIEWTVLEPDVLSEKIYIPGVGQVKEFDVAGGTEILQLTKVATP